MTSLATQLKQLARPQTEAVQLREDPHRKSLLFDPKEAARLDQETFYDIGLNGLYELINLDTDFQEFEATLFDEASKSLERSVQSKEFNASLDDKINEFLLRLIPYLPLRQAHKALEWLVHRFHIYHYNKEGLMRCILPYYETKIFVRILQLIDISDPTSHWHWLHPLQNAGVPLSRTVLLNQCSSNLGFLKFVGDILLKAIKAHSGSKENASNVLRVVIAFYASTFVGTLENIRVITENHVSALLPYLLKGLKSKMVDYKAATYMVVCQLVVKATLKEELLHPLINSLSKHLVPSLALEGLASLAVISQTQDISSIPEKAFRSICRLPDLVRILEQLSGVHNIEPLMALFLPPLICSTIEETQETRSDDESDALESIHYCALLENILQGVELKMSSAKMIASGLLNGYIEFCSELSKEEAHCLKLRLAKVIHILETRYAVAMDVVMETFYSLEQQQEFKDLAQNFLGISLSGIKHQVLPVSDTSLVLSLNHPQPHAREIAVRQLLENTKPGANIDDFFVSSVIARMNDDDANVILAALWCEESLLCCFPTEQLFEALLAILRKWRGRTDAAWYKVGQRVLTLLTTSNLWSNNTDIVDRAMVTLLPYLFPTTQNFTALLKLTQIILNAAMTSHHALLTNIASVYTTVDGDDSDAEKVYQLTKSLVNLLGTNMATINKEDRLRLTNLLYCCAEEEEGSIKPLRFLAIAIATSTIQHMTNAVERMEMCQQIVSFLEPEVIKICAVKGKKLTAILEEGPAAISSNWAAAALPSHFTLNLGLRLVDKKKSRVVGSHKIDIGLAEVTLWALSNIVKGIHLSDDFSCTALRWLDSEHVELRLYSSLLKKLFSVFMAGVSDSRASVFCKAFKDLSIQLFKLHLFNASVLWEFFATIWLDQLNNMSASVLKIHSLNVAAAAVRGFSNEQVHSLLTSDSIVFPSLLGVLCSPVEPVRRAGASLLHAMKDKLEKDCLAAYSLLLRHLNKRREEIVADANQLPQILSVFINKQSTASPKQGSGSVTKQAALSALLHCLVGSLPSSVKHAVLIALRSTDEKVVVTHSYALLDELLVQLVESNSLSLTDSHNVSLILEHFTPATAGLMDGPCQGSFNKALSVDVLLAGSLGSPQEIALSQLTKPFFLAIESIKIQEKMLSKVLDIVMSSANPSVPSVFMKILKKLPLSSKHLKNEFTKLEVTTKSSIRETRKARRLAQEGTAEQQSIDKETFQRITYVMELLQQRKIKHIDDPELLTPCLFTVLQRCLNVAKSEDHSSVEYLQQLVLTLLQNLCLYLSPDGESIPSDVLSEDQINVELVVQCVRVSDNPQTQNHALLLLGTLAKLFPERVLHNIMSIFTFMGAHLLRQDDNYSFQVIQRTVQTIIPTLVKASDTETPEGTLTGGTDNVVAMVLRVFVDALPHVPEHRQMMLFTELVATLGHKRYLWMLIVLLLTGHVEKSGGVEGKEEEEQKLSNIFKLPLSLCHQSPCITQLSTLTMLLKYLLTLPHDKPVEPQTPKRVKKTLKAAKAGSQGDTELFNVGNHSARQLRQFKFNTVTFIITLLATDEFVGQVAEMSELEVEALNPLYQTLIDTTLQLITMSARSLEADAGKVTVKFWKALIHKAYGIMDKVNSLLSMDLFVRVVLGLLSSPTPVIRRKALQLLNSKILQHMGSLDEKQVSMVLTVLDHLVLIAKSSPDVSSDQDESFINQQTALYSLKLICKLAGSSHPQQFGPVIDVAIQIIANSNSNLQVVSSACLLLGEVVRCMKAHTIPSIPRFMPSLLQQLEPKETPSSSDLHLVSVLMAVYRVMETLPHFLNPYLLQLTQQICRFSVNSEDSKSQLNLRLRSVAHHLAASLAPRVLLPVISQVYDTLVTTNQAGIASLMAILKEHVTLLGKEDLKAQMGTLQALFMNALDFRSIHSKDDMEKAKTVESHILDALLSLVMRLSEVSFRPLFLKLYNWATRGSVQSERLLTFYQVTDMLAERMKSIFTLFAGHMIKNCAELLDHCNSTKSSEQLFTGTKCSLLLHSILSTLYKVFLYDKEGFVSKERFEMFMIPLLNQVENTSIGEVEYEALISRHLTPCIAQMMTCAQDTGCWQPLNYQLLLKTRHSEPKVRFATLVILEEVHKQLGEEFLTLLPETLPFLSELLEDESTEVEMQCQKVIGQLEKTLGEPLNKYF
ncbi:HEAT repeat-containing protein 1-like [Anneissia japonica]|uniref:HEAT repeat-containing protein 1-like n=1 Tax=Anneissia japonica TaxID=1529436 RepID=UPI001425B49E|nr:HEAT repeat-containing protein 1-like [Anneissia japonica]XP_033103568.1 HEAT repeat-containing protein 1-like [Anneissia japonica]XP_033103569.1 HEAT repeat-containing protein 1-like [Anneissia japonica]